MKKISRRAFLIATPALLAACTTTRPPNNGYATQPSWRIPEEARIMYGPVMNEPYPIRAVDLTKIEPRYWRQIVDYPTTEMPGTLVVDTQNRFLYLIMENGRALRYGVGVGKSGLAFEGVGDIGVKREWPRWTPTATMMKRDPERYGHLGGGMAPGIENPLGARALYLYKNGRDTYYRIHGSMEEWSIGNAVSSGCIRLINQDVIDLYNRVPVNTRVVVLQDETPAVTPLSWAGMSV